MEGKEEEENEREERRRLRSRKGRKTETGGARRGRGREKGDRQGRKRRQRGKRETRILRLSRVIGQAEKGEGFHLPSAYFLVLEIPSSPRSVDRVKLVMYVYKRH